MSHRVSPSVATIANAGGGTTTNITGDYDHAVVNFTGTGAGTIGNPVSTTAGRRFRLTIRNSSGGAITPGLSAGYRTTAIPAIASGQQAHADLVYDSGLAKWVGEWSIAY